MGEALTRPITTAHTNPVTDTKKPTGARVDTPSLMDMARKSTPGLLHRQYAHEGTYSDMTHIFSTEMSDFNSGLLFWFSLAAALGYTSGKLFTILFGTLLGRLQK